MNPIELYITELALKEAFQLRIHRKGLPLRLEQVGGRWFIRPFEGAGRNWEQLARVHLNEEFDRMYP